MTGDEVDQWRPQTHVIDGVLVEVYVESLTVIVRLFPPPKSANGWKEKIIFFHPKSGKRRRLPEMDELIELVKSSKHNAHYTKEKRKPKP